MHRITGICDLDGGPLGRHDRWRGTRRLGLCLQNAVRPWAASPSAELPEVGGHLLELRAGGLFLLELHLETSNRALGRYWMNISTWPLLSRDPLGAPLAPQAFFPLRASSPLSFSGGRGDTDGVEGAFGPFCPLGASCWPLCC